MHLVCVRRGSERTGFCSYDAANVSVKARRPSVAHPEYNRQCQCSGELFTMTCRDYGFFFSENFLSVTSHHISNYARNMNGERNAPVGCFFRRVRKIAESDSLLYVCPSLRT